MNMKRASMYELHAIDKDKELAVKNFQILSVTLEETFLCLN